MSNMLGQAVGMMHEGPTLEEATEALDEAMSAARAAFGALNDFGGNVEVRAFRALLLTETVNLLGSAAYDYQRAAHLAAKPKK